MDQKNLKEIIKLTKQIEELSQCISSGKSKDVNTLLKQIEKLAYEINDAANPNKQAVKGDRVNSKFNEVVKHTANIALECKNRTGKYNIASECRDIRKIIGAKP
jgi:hypothetical protein